MPRIKQKFDSSFFLVPNLDIECWRLSVQSFLFKFCLFFLIVIPVPLLSQTSSDSSTTTVQNPQVTLAAVGDIIVHDSQLKAAWRPEKDAYDFDMSFTLVQSLLGNADLTLANLETTLPGRPELYSGYPRFGTPDALASALKNAGVDLLTTANNHALDKGKWGLLRTLDMLDSLGFYHIGTYRDTVEYWQNRILYIEKNGLKLAFLNYTYALNGILVPRGIRVGMIRQNEMMADVAEARFHKPDAIIVLLHAGKEYQREPDAYQKKQVEFLFNQGVDVVLGGHPHVLQPFELKKVTDKYGVTKPRLVIWSLGNFISNQRDRYRDGGIVFKFRLTKQDSLINIDNITYDPVYVHRMWTKSGRKHILLPVKEFLKNDRIIKLPYNEFERMMTFYNDTNELLEPCLKQVQEFSKLQTIMN